MMSIPSRSALATLLAAVAVGGATTSARADTILVKGPPALTQEMVDKSAHLAEWALGLQLTPAQRAEWTGILVNFWKSESLADIGGILDVSDLDDRLRAMSPEERDRLARHSRPALIEQLKRNAATAPDDRFLLATYEAWNDRPLVPAKNGLPALTPSMMNDYASIMALIYDIRLDETQRKMLDGHVLRTFQTQDKPNIQNVVDWIAKEKELRAQGPGMRMGVGRFDLYPVIIEQAKKDATTDPEVRDLLAISVEQHRPLAGGTGPNDPALQRREVEAFLGVLFFIASKAEGLNGPNEIRPPLEVMDAFVEAMRQGWSEIPAENKTNFAEMPDLYAKMLVLWDKTEADVQKSFIDAIGGSPQGQEVRARVKELAAADAARTKELQQQRDATRAAAASRASAAKSGRPYASPTAAVNTPNPIGPSHATAGAAAGTSAKSGTGGGGDKPAMSDFAKASHDLAMERMKVQMISNMMNTMHETRMMTIYNTGGNGFTWERR